MGAPTWGWPSDPVCWLPRQWRVTNEALFRIEPTVVKWERPPHATAKATSGLHRVTDQQIHEEIARSPARLFR